MFPRDIDHFPFRTAPSLIVWAGRFGLSNEERRFVISASLERSGSTLTIRSPGVSLTERTAQNAMGQHSQPMFFKRHWRGTLALVAVAALFLFTFVYAGERGGVATWTTPPPTSVTSVVTPTTTTIVRHSTRKTPAPNHQETLNDTHS